MVSQRTDRWAAKYTTEGSEGYGSIVLLVYVDRGGPAPAPSQVRELGSCGKNGSVHQYPASRISISSSQTRRAVCTDQGRN